MPGHVAEVPSVRASAGREHVERTHRRRQPRGSPVDRVGVVVIRHRRRVVAEIVAERLEAADDLLARGGMLRVVVIADLEAVALQRLRMAAIVAILARRAAGVRRSHRRARPHPSRRLEPEIREEAVYAFARLDGLRIRIVEDGKREPLPVRPLDGRAHGSRTPPWCRRCRGCRSSCRPDRSRCRNGPRARR